MLEAKDLSKSFQGAVALSNLNLRVEAGEIYCLLGHNGAGKTTTMNLFLGFLQPDAGAAVVDGVIMHADPERGRKTLAYIPENIALYEQLSGLENLAYFRALSGGDTNNKGLLELLGEAGLPSEAAMRRAGSYSKGMRQKVGIAAALARGANNLLLDEPSSGLDPKAARELSELLRKLAGQGRSILMATHDLYQVVNVAGRIGIMRRGELVAEVRADEITQASLEALYFEHMDAA
jgi:ABC-2 type transport system ATP-binding protein